MKVFCWKSLPPEVPEFPFDQKWFAGLLFQNDVGDDRQNHDGGGDVKQRGHFFGFAEDQPGEDNAVHRFQVYIEQQGKGTDVFHQIYGFDHGVSRK